MKRSPLPQPSPLSLRASTLAGVALEFLLVAILVASQVVTYSQKAVPSNSLPSSTPAREEAASDRFALSLPYRASASSTAAAESTNESGAFRPRLPRSNLELQIALARKAISPGSLDGVLGPQTRAAIKAFQESEHLDATGIADAATKAKLLLTAPPLESYEITTNDLSRLTPIGATWLAKSQQERLDYSTILELVAERGWSHPKLIRLLNPELDWAHISPGTIARIPSVQFPNPTNPTAFVRIGLAERMLDAFDANTNLLAHFPCSIARLEEKRPVGQLSVVLIASDPMYRFDPAIFPESIEGRELGRSLLIPPGPNNPVGNAWIGLNLPGYGIHGTPEPEAVGRTESHGCFRLANWNARYLTRLVQKGTAVFVVP